MYIPTLSRHVLEQKFPVNFKGVAIGNGLLDESMIGSSLIHFGYFHGLIDQPLYQKVLRTCCSTFSAGSDLSKCDITSANQTIDCILARGTAVNQIHFDTLINPYNIYKSCEKSDDKVFSSG